MSTTTASSKDFYRVLTVSLAALTGLLFLAYVVVAHGYAFWRPDTWEYLGGPRNEFEFNYRWLLPPFFYAMRNLPSYPAWVLSAVLFGYLGYSTARRFLRGSPWDSKAIGILVAGYFVLSPGLQDQFTWPSHSLAVILLLVICDYLKDRVPMVPLILVSTPIVFGLHQGFAFLTILLLIPSYEELARASSWQGFWRIFKALLWWTASCLIAWLLSQLIVHLYFGHISEISAWRRPHPASSLSELFANLARNLGVMVLRLEQYYSRLGLAAVGILLVIGSIYVAWRAPRENRQYIWLALLGVAIYLSVYLVTAPVGTQLPFRLTLLFGPAFAVVTFAVLASVRKPALVLTAATALTAYPAIGGLANMHWFAGYTQEILAAVVEIRPENPAVMQGVLIDGSRVTSPERAPGMHPDYRWGFRQSFQEIGSPYAFSPAFLKSGFRNVYLCGVELRGGEPAQCADISKTTVDLRCATQLTAICSAGVGKDGYWIVRI